MEADFSGYATRADIKCSDGRTITPDAFKHQDKIEVPLVWQHVHDSPMNVLGRAVLEHRDASHPEGAGIYCYGYFNDTDAGKTVKELVVHKDVKALSIYANNLVEKAKTVLHGAIREVSLVLSGANPGALIDNIRLSHGDGSSIDTLEDEAVIFTGLEINVPESAEVAQHAEKVAEEVAHAAGSDSNSEDVSLEDIYNGMTEKEKEVVHHLVGVALASAGKEDEDGDDGVKHSDDTGNESDDTESDDDKDTDTDTEGDLTHQEGTDNMSRNIFDNSSVGPDASKRLTHDQLVAIVAEGKKTGSFKEAVLAHAATYGIENIELMFPEAQALTTSPEFISRRMEWVASVLAGTKKSPFAKVKTLFADITKEEARAKGYIKGNRKEEEVFGLLQRTTGPTTIYKKQKLDRDDILDITDVNVVAWLKAEMRLMIEEELARAILVGDGRSNLSPDKVKDPAGAVDGNGIRSVLNDDDLYAIKVELAANVSPRDSVKGLVRALDQYKGSGRPTMYISRSELTELLLEDDRFGRPLYSNKAELADKIGVGEIVTVDLFDEYDNLYAIIVSLADYTVGTNRGGELTSFEDFDIDFNQYKYLQETRLSGGLTKPFSAIVVHRAEGTLATAAAPSFDGDTNVITIPSSTGVVYTIDGDEVPAGPTDPITEATEVRAEPADGHYLATGTTRSWTYAP